LSRGPCQKKPSETKKGKRCIDWSLLTPGNWTVVGMTNVNITGAGSEVKYN
jgi:hypothetical protein